jgi:hypothetical protein
MLRRLSCYILGLLLAGLCLPLNSCALPRVSAEQRLFLPLKVELLGRYNLAKTDFQGYPVGGLSGITYDAGRDRFYAVSDNRADAGPARFYTLKMQIGPLGALSQEKPDFSRGPQRNSQGDSQGDIQIQQITVESQSALQDANGQPFLKGTVDPEGIALSQLDSVFVSSEGVSRDGIPAFVHEYALDGQFKRALPLPEWYLPKVTDSAVSSTTSSAPSPTESPAPSPTASATPDPEGQQRRGIRNNLGLEGLTVSRSGPGEPFHLFTATESALRQDQPLPNSSQPVLTRLLHYLVQPDKALLLGEYAYPLEITQVSPTAGLSEILSIDPAGHFLVLERALTKLGLSVQLYQMTTAGATDISGISNLIQPGVTIKPLRKQLLLDLDTLGIPLDNLEGLTLGPRLSDGSRSLILMSDDNFSQNQVNQFLLFRIQGLR